MHMDGVICGGTPHQIQREASHLHVEITPSTHTHTFPPHAIMLLVPPNDGSLRFLVCGTVGLGLLSQKK